MDRQIRFRIILYASVLALFTLAAVTPGTDRLFLLIILVPLTFSAVGALLLALPFLAMEHAEGERVPWHRPLDFLQHNSLLAFVDVMLLWTTAVVAATGLPAMGPAGVAVFAVAVAAGGSSALADWLLGNESDHDQAAWQRHPR